MRRPRLPCMHSSSGDCRRRSRILSALCCGHSQDDVLLAYQVCFDLFENEQQSFSLQVRSAARAS